jgi:large subunit ribosomal protein L29
VRAEELRALELTELEDRLKSARRELYELRFKLAVGQLENHRQIRKTRKDIARILTVLHQRRSEEPLVGAAVPPAAASPVPVAATPEHVEAAGRDEPTGAPAPNAQDRGSEDPESPGTDREADDD